MKKLSIKKLSILGLVLMAASAVTAAILPRANDNKFAADGSLTQVGTNDGYTCELSNIRTAPCHVTASASTASGQADSTVGGVQTVNNTTLSGDIAD